jgi:N-acetylglucosaminyldiphosphoundecaprenol N-acetyl-beta-D-mannosaminyltransferase
MSATTATAREVSIASFSRVNVAGCPVDAICFDDAIEEICRRIEQKRRTHILFINAAKIAKYHREPQLREVVDRADLLLADGVPVVWASRLLRRALPGRVNGTDLMDAMIATAAERGYRVFLLGARPEVVAKTAEVFKSRHPNLQIAGMRSGYFTDQESAAVVQEINASGADLLLIGMSTPRKEFWVDQNLSQLKVSVAQGVGGSFDVTAGVVERAPVWMQRSGLEWLHRLLQEPGRMWRRYLETNSLFLLLVLRDLVSPKR